MSLVYLKNKKNGTVYVYECVSFWDKVKKKPASKRSCIGKLHPTTKKIIPSKRLESSGSTISLVAEPTAAVQSVGAVDFLNHICQILEIDEILKSSFPEHWELILSLAYFQAMDNKPLSKIEHWTEVHRHPYSQFIDHRRVSELLPLLTEGRQMDFFRKWAKHRLKEECLAYDITSVSSYSELNNMVRYGYNRDEENLPQVNLALLFGEKSLLPIYFRSLPGSIRDVSTLKNILQITEFLELKKPHAVMDKGFFSHDNVRDLFANRMKFTMAIPFTCKFARDQVEKVRPTIEHHENFIQVNGQNIFCNSLTTKWEGRRVYVHTYYNAHVGAEEYEKFLTDLYQWKKELETNTPVPERQLYYDLYLFVKETPKRGRKVTYNQQAIDAYKQSRAGFLVLLSNVIKDPVRALQIYRNKDVAEKTFDNLKNVIDSKRLRVHLDESMKGRLFIQFIALIFISYILKIAHEKDIFKLFGSVSSILDELKLRNEILVSSRAKPIFTETTKSQRIILEAFGFDSW